MTMKTKMQTITKAQLIEALRELDEALTRLDAARAKGELDDDTPICFASDYGDYSHTQQLHPLTGEIDTAIVKESAYSESGFACAEPGEIAEAIFAADDNPDGSDEGQMVIILK